MISKPSISHRLSPLSEQQKSERKRTALLRAGEGFYLLLAVILPLVLLDVIELSLSNWINGTIATTIVWGVMLALVVSGLDRHLRFFDQHFLVVPALGAAALISYFAYLMPDLRILVLGGWFTVLLFGGGLMTFRQSAVLSLAMGLGYIAAICAIAADGYPINLRS